MNESISNIPEGTSDIDFVVIWVDGADPEWRTLRAKYANNESDSDEARYRDWGILKYWFRAIEKYAPWVRKVHFVTNGQKPEWLNINSPKVNFVKHSDFIPEEYLPTFSSRTIELNLHRIKGLSDKFVYFNDDTFLNAPVKPEDFFVNGMPCDCAILSTIKIERNGISSIVLNDLKIINDHFSFKESYKKFHSKWFNVKYGKQLLRTILLKPWGYFVGFYEMHIPYSYTKAVFEELWNREYEVLNHTCLHRFRDDSDVNQYLLRYWQIAKGDFVPRSVNIGKLYFSTDSIIEICAEIKEKRHKMFCISDSNLIEDFESVKNQIHVAFEDQLPEKSLFEM